MGQPERREHMPKKQKQQPRRDKSEDQILRVFQTLQLPTEPPAKPVVMPQSGTVVFYRITGDSQPIRPQQ
jgi:hypothetical protein